MRLSWLATVVSLLCLPLASFSHHSTAPHYDRDQPVKFTGVVNEFEFINPHVVLHVEVAADNGESIVTWVCISSAANTLRRRGWTARQFVPGQYVTVSGIAARRDPFGCAFTSVEVTGGRVDEPGIVSPASPLPEVDEPPVLAGNWMRDRTRRSEARPPISANPDAFTAAGLAAQAGYDQRFDDPSFECSAASITRAWDEPGTPTAIEQTNQQLVIRHEYMDTVRTIQLGTREHPPDLAARPYGHSVGWYEGSTLVIDTIGFEAGVLTPHPGILHSAQLHTVERLSLSPEEGTMELEWVAEDPLFFGEPLTGSIRFTSSPFSVEPYGCVQEKAQR
ncbi:MAG: DUF6152 family protein [Gammaproteobacteria bacterium]